MATNLVDTLTKKLGYPPLLKVDPNTGEVKLDDNSYKENKFSQAAIPTVLIGIYRFTQIDEGAEKLLKGQPNNGWVQTIFGNLRHEAMEHIATYAGIGADEAVVKLNEVADSAVTSIRENMPENATIADVKKFMANQRNNILPYLPGALHMGETVNDPTIDDNINKMEGPVSNLMKAIGGMFSEPVVEKESQKQK